MRIIGLIVFIITALIIYLWQSYAGFFDGIRLADLKPPVLETEYHLGDPTGQKKVVTFIGDSLTAGVGSTSSKNVIGYRVAEKLAKSDAIELHNIGIPAARVNWLLPISESAKNSKSDLTVIFIGINDVFNRTPVNEFSTDLDRLVFNIKSSSQKTVIVTIPFLGTPHSVPFPFDILYNYQLTRYNYEIKTIANKYDLQVIDLYMLTQNKLNEADLFSADYFHPSDKGYILLSEIINQELTL